MRKEKSNFAIIVVLQYVIGICILVMIAFFLSRYDLKFQSVFRKILLFLLIIKVTMNSFKVMKIREADNKIAKEERGDYFAIIFIAAIIVAIISVFPLEKNIGADILCEDVLFRDEYRYYDKKYICLKKEFQWDAEHDIRLLEETHGVEYSYDENSYGKNRTYIPANNQQMRIEIIDYPTVLNANLRTKESE